MICSQCGTNNGKTSKYCRECGKRLIIESLELETGIAAAPIETPDDQAVTDTLYEALKMFERDNLEEAFRLCRQALGLNPASTSARSLLAVIYEKKADDQAALGNLDDSQDYINAAIRQIERTLEANPNSEADLEKLQSLRAKLGEPLPKPERVRVVETVRSRLRWIPLPVAISAGTVILVFLFIILAFGASGGKSRSQQSARTDAQKQPNGPRFATGQPQTYPAPGGQNYGYPQQQPYAAQPQQPYVYPQQQPQPGYGTQPSRQPTVPALQPAPEPVRPLTPVPGATPSAASGTARPRPEEPRTGGSTPPAPEPSHLEEARQAYGRGDYASAASLLQNAISSGSDTPENNQLLGTCLYNLGRGAEAVNRFQRAIDLYLEQKSRGQGVAAADQGIRTCKQFIELARE